MRLGNFNLCRGKVVAGFPAVTQIDWALIRNFSTVEITASCIVKTYTSSDAEVRIQHLENIYTLLRHRNVPNTDHIMLTKGKTLYFVPRGIPVPSKNQADLRGCLVCVLEALVVSAVN